MVKIAAEEGIVYNRCEIDERNDLCQWKNTL